MMSAAAAELHGRAALGCSEKSKHGEAEFGRFRRSPSYYASYLAPTFAVPDAPLVGHVA